MTVEFKYVYGKYVSANRQILQIGKYGKSMRD